MAMNNRCNCNQVPCQCHTVCRTPAVCVPPAPSRRPKLPISSVEGILKLINDRCSAEVCEILQLEMDMLYLLLGLEDHRPGKPTLPGQPVKPGLPVKPPLPHKAFQFIANMTEILTGDLTDLYPSAELLKVQLKALWECMHNKQEYHGMWKDNYTTRTVITTDDKCALDGDKDPAPKKLKVITPVDIGSIVSHKIKGKTCLFESLVDNNTVEPSRMSVLDGLWLNYCDLKEVIQCVLPKHKLVDCHEACADPDHDGVVTGATLCERVANIETAAKSAELPSGYVVMVEDVVGVPTVVFDDNPSRKEVNLNGSHYSLYTLVHKRLVLGPKDFSYMATVGEELIISGNASISYSQECKDKDNGSCVSKWGTEVYVDGSLAKKAKHMYCMNRTGAYAGLADNFSCKVLTTGKPMVIEFNYLVQFTEMSGVHGEPSAVKGDKFSVNMGTAVLTFAKGDKSVVVT